MSKIIAVGAEATITLADNIIVKERVKKSYRHETIDSELRKKRTRREAKVLEKISTLIPTPHLIEVDEKKHLIKMEYVDGPKVRDVIEQNPTLASVIGEQIKKLHDNDIMHGDLTTSNMILCEDKVYFIDYGLSFNSTKIEDKAVDLHLLRQALESKHHTISKKAFKMVLKAYNDDEVEKRLVIVESRGKNKGKA
ncbi:Kae1-associated serine/threonine protein kinase [Candidatus Woesearchaeota archaeon]|nr:Kae1-associated serine/threonine protein kinase [Candidatus Woesearchaeota archaeon]